MTMLETAFESSDGVVAGVLAFAILSRASVDLVGATVATLNVLNKDRAAVVFSIVFIVAVVKLVLLKMICLATVDVVSSSLGLVVMVIFVLVPMMTRVGVAVLVNAFVIAEVVEFFFSVTVKFTLG